MCKYEPISGPTFAIPIPVNKYGYGPVRPSEAFCTVWEVWDQCATTWAKCDTEYKARLIAQRLGE